MSFAVVPVNSGQQTGGFTLPNYCSFCVSASDGSGGQVFINGLGINDPTVAGAYDLETIFTSAGFTWRSRPLLRAFRPIGSINDAADQFHQYLEINSFLMDGAGGTDTLGFAFLYGISGGPSNAPYLGIGAPTIAGIWRVDLKLRHSITN